jgi:hypothetical protein
MGFKALKFSITNFKAFILVRDFIYYFFKSRLKLVLKGDLNEQILNLLSQVMDQRQIKF